MPIFKRKQKLLCIFEFWFLVS